MDLRAVLADSAADDHGENWPTHLHFSLSCSMVATPNPTGDARISPKPRSRRRWGHSRPIQVEKKRMRLEDHCNHTLRSRAEFELSTSSPTLPSHRYLCPTCMLRWSSSCTRMRMMLQVSVLFFITGQVQSLMNYMWVSTERVMKTGGWRRCINGSGSLNY